MNLLDKIPVEIIIERDFKLKRSGNRYLRGIKHDSLVVDKQKNLFYWNSIDLNGNALTWLKEVRGYSHRAALEFLESFSGIPFTSNIVKLEKPTPIYPRLLDAFYNLGKQNRGYWYARGFSDKSIDTYKLGYTGEYYVIPILDSGELVNFQCRRKTDSGKRIWNWAKERPSYLFGLEQVPKTDFIVLTEGPIDAITLNAMGLPAISHNAGSSGWNNSWNKHLLKYNFIYVAYDNDRAGIKGSIKVAKKIGNRASVVFWPSEFATKYDINDLYLEFGKEFSKQIFRKILLLNSVHISLFPRDYRQFVKHKRAKLDKEIVKYGI